jgi:hypothetical protein
MGLIMEDTGSDRFADVCPKRECLVDSAQGVSNDMIIYTGPVDDAHAAIQFFRHEVDKLRALKKVVVSPEKTVVKDVNGDGIEFPGLTYGCSTLDELLRELGVVFSPQVLHNPNATASRIKEFVLSAKWTWGHDRVM